MRTVEFPWLRCRALAAALLWLVTPPGAAESPAEQVLAAVVDLRAQIPGDARTAMALGLNRAGSGVVIDADGLVLTIGYLILEASEVMVSNHEDTFVEASIIAYDAETGFGLVRAQKPLGIEPIQLGESGVLSIGDSVLAVSGGGQTPIVATRIVSRRTYPGYWEYLLDDAILTAPPHPQFGGAALIDMHGQLVGIGSLIIQDAAEPQSALSGNMFVPIDALKPVLDELVTHGRRQAPARPWLGVYTTVVRGHLMVSDVAADGPAERAGVQRDDIIFSVTGERISDMADFYRKVWALGDAGVEIQIGILRAGEIKQLVVQSGDRYEWLKLSKGRKLST